MKLKRIMSALLLAMCISLVSPVIASTPAPVATETPKEALKNKIETRLIEINNMDKSELTKTEKKDLRKEVKDLKKQARSQGIYLSVGAIIIIILLLILFL